MHVYSCCCNNTTQCNVLTCACYHSRLILQVGQQIIIMSSILSNACVVGYEPYQVRGGAGRTDCVVVCHMLPLLLGVACYPLLSTH